MRRRWVLVPVVVVLLAVLVIAGRVVWAHTHRTPLQQALSLVPAASKRISFTDWSAVRKRLDVPTSEHPSKATVQKLVNRAYDSDLSSASSIDDSAVALQSDYGFSPATATWEAYAQSTAGATMVLQLPKDANMGRIADTLQGLGYKAPTSSTGVWIGGADLVNSIDQSITPELQYVVLLASKHLVVTSDNSGYAATAGKVAEGKAPSAGSVSSVSAMAGRVKSSAAAMIWTRDFACSDLAMSHADQGDQDQGNQLIAAAGKVSPLSGLVMSMAPSRTLTVAEEFDSSDQATSNLRARARLAVGEAPGRGDSFSDDFKLTSSRSDGSTVLLALKPRTKSGFVLSALYDGPVLFATC